MNLPPWGHQQGCRRVSVCTYTTSTTTTTAAAVTVVFIHVLRGIDSCPLLCFCSTTAAACCVSSFVEFKC